MAQNQIADYEARVRAILATYSGIGTDVSAGAAIANLPAYEATCTTATGRRRRSGKRNVVTREMRVWVYVSEMGDAADEANARTQLAAAKALIDPIADFLTAHTNLKLSDAGITAEIGDIEDNGAGELVYNKVRYAGFYLLFTFTYARSQ